MVVTDDDEQNERLIALRYNGCVNRETCIEPSANGRIDTLQAALLLVRHRRLQSLLERRRENAAFYNEALSDFVQTPPVASGRHAYYTYTIQVDRRDALRDFLEERGIETKVQHKILMPEQPAYRERARGEWDNARRLRDRILCIPAHEKLDPESRAYVAEQIREFYA